MSDLPAPTDPAELRRAVSAIEWYHTLELAPGLRTPGWLNHEPILDQVPLPASLAGKRVLDVATFNGYWAFEMERRGASEVIGIDVLDPYEWDWPVLAPEETVAALSERMASGDGFNIAKAALGSKVERLNRSVYDLDRADVGGFDLVYVGSLLIHLRDPIKALERVRSVCDGELVLVDGIDLPLTLKSPRGPAARLDGRGRPWWWWANQAGLIRMVETAGFEITNQPRRIFVPGGVGWPTRRLNPNGLRSREGRHYLTVAWAGDPHLAITARPRTA